MKRYSMFLLCFGILSLALGCSQQPTQENPAGQETTGSDASVQDQSVTTENTATTESAPTDSTGVVQDTAPQDEAKSEDKAISSIKLFIEQQKIDTSSSDWKLKLPKPTQATFDSSRTYYWVLKTNKGTLKIELNPSVAPMHVTSTIYLTLLGFYDDLTFHRVIKGFMAQGGDPLGSGRGGPGYKYAGEFSSTAKHDSPGTLSMANAGPNTDGSQFFITFVKTPHLDGKHTVFGLVKDGMSTLKALEAAGSSTGKTSEKLFIEKASIVVE